MCYLHDSNITISVRQRQTPKGIDHTSRDSALGSGLSALESNKTLIMRPVTMCPWSPLWISNPLKLSWIAQARRWPP